METKQPVKKIRVGNVHVDVWENDGKEGRKFLSTTIAKSYKDIKGEWQNTNSFGVADLPKLALAVGEAYRFCYMEHKFEGSQDQ